MAWKSIAWKSIAKLANREQLLDFLGEVGTHIIRRSLNFPHQFSAAVANGNQVFKIAARGKSFLPRPAKASNFEAQKYTGATNRIFKPFSSSRPSECIIAGSYHVFENPRIFASRGMTSSVVVFCRQRQSGAPSLVSS
jgi:hypothetical protein